MNHAEIERWYRLRNIKKASQIIIVVSVGSLIAGFAVSGYLKSAVSPRANSSIDSSHIRIENFVYSSPGMRPWELKATEAVAADSIDKIRLAGPTVVYEGGKGGKIYLTAKTGELDKSNSSISGRGLVTIHYRDLKFTTASIDYSEEKMSAETSSPVSLEGGDLSLTGKGLKVSVPEEEIVIESNVRARLYDVKWVGPGQRLPI
jgi:LPS export ABC transporter protein LptC